MNSNNSNSNSNTGGRAVIYCRASSDKQELSTKQQIASCLEYANRHGLSVLDVYEDSGYTGTRDSRPAFQRMVAAVRAGGKRRPFDVVLIWKLNRFARNSDDSIVYKRLLTRAGVQVVSITQSLGDGAVGALTESVLAAIDEFFSANLAEDITRGQRSVAGAGYWMTRPPYGYRLTSVQVGEKTKRRLEIDAITSPVVRLIFALAAAGHSGVSIAKRLNADGVPPPSGTGRWRGGRVVYLIRSRVYLGELIWGSTRKLNGRRTPADDAQVIRRPDNHPALVDQATFDRAVELLDGRGAQQHPRSVASSYLLSGLMSCGSCAGPMVGATRSLAGRHRDEGRRYSYQYYRCNQRDADAACTSKAYLRRNEVEAQVLDQIAARVLDAGTIAELVKLSNAYLEDTGDTTAERAALEDAVTSLKAAKRRLMRLVEQGLDDDADVTARLRELTGQIQQHDQRLYQLAAAEAAQPPLLDAAELMAYAESLRFVMSTGDREEVKSILRGFIRRVDVSYPNVTITFSLPMPPLALPPVVETLLSPIDSKA